MKNTYALKGQPETAARILSETKSSYLLGFSDNHTLHFPKKRLTEPFYVGDIVQHDVNGTGQESLTLLERHIKITKASNGTMKSYHFSQSDQVLATNIDQLFIAMALDQNFSLAKLESYVLVFSQENLELTILLTKKDTSPHYKQELERIHKLYPNLQVLAVSIYDSDSIEKLRSFFQPEKIGMFIGSSGAGKSSLINLLQDDFQVRVNAVRNDSKGKHTTTSSLFIPCQKLNYYLIDTPGFKGIDTHHTIDADILFGEIEELAQQCMFRNCQHLTEPRCAIKAALETGKLDPVIWQRYRHNIEKMKLLSKRRKSWRL